MEGKEGSKIAAGSGWTNFSLAPWSLRGRSRTEAHMSRFFCHNV